MMEAAVVFGWMGQIIHVHEPLGRTVASLPDSRDLWEVIWESRRYVAGIAHSHPGSGRTGPSQTDLTTFAAVEAALGMRLNWPIATRDHVVCVGYEGTGTDYDEHGNYRIPGPGQYETCDMTLKSCHCLSPWLPKLREISNY